MKYFIYILYSQDFDKYYIGQTHDLEARIKDHNQGDRPGQSRKFTYKYRPWTLVASFITGKSRAEAMKIEKIIKAKKSRTFLEQLIKYQNDREVIAQLIGVPIQIGINQ